MSVSGDYGIVNQIEFQGRSFAGASVSNYGVVQTGDVVYTKSPLNSNPYGIIKTNKGKPGIVSTLYAVYHPKENAFSDFIQVYFEQHARMNNYMHPLVNKGAKNDMKVSAENALKGPVCFPSRIEQESISAFFSVLDHLITLHQRQLFLHSTPDISLSVRLIHPFYTSSWEQRKVQDVADRFDNLRIPVAANLRVHGTTPYYGANGIQDYVEGFTHDGEFVLVAEDGANDLKNYPVKCVNGRIWVNNHAHVLQGKAGISDNSFLAFAISQSDIESLLVGGSRAKLNAETLMSIEFKLPCLQEQYRIGEYLTQLDHLITLHQRKGKAAVSGCFLNCFSLEKSSAQSRTLELFGQISNQEIKYIIDGLSILGGKLRNFCVKLIILLSYTRINDIAKYHISRNTECVHNIN